MFEFTREDCTHCGICEFECHYDALKFDDEGVLHCDETKCAYCGHCMAMCPTESIIVEGEGYDIEDIETFEGTPATKGQIRELIMMRRSIRDFNDEPVTDDELFDILEMAKYAPTAMNKQDNLLVVIEDTDKRGEALDLIMSKAKEVAEQIKDTNPVMAQRFLDKHAAYQDGKNDTFFYGAPVVIFVYSTNDIDGAICATTMGQMISARGLGYCFIGGPTPILNDPEVKAKFDVPEDKHCVIGIALGHTDLEYFCTVARKHVPVIWK